MMDVNCYFVSKPLKLILNNNPFLIHPNRFREMFGNPTIKQNLLYMLIYLKEVVIVKFDLSMVYGLAVLLLRRCLWHLRNAFQ